MSVRVLVNGEPRVVAAGTAVDRVVAAVTDLDAGIAVAVNGEVVPRRRWPGTLVEAGDQIEVVMAVQGG
jgi:sulfur carrier protein